MHPLTLRGLPLQNYRKDREKKQNFWSPEWLHYSSVSAVVVGIDAESRPERADRWV